MTTRPKGPYDRGLTGPLSIKQTLVLTQLSCGFTTDEIAASLQIKPETVRTHLRRARAKLDATSSAHAVGKALRLGAIR